MAYLFAIQTPQRIVARVVKTMNEGLVLALQFGPSLPFTAYKIGGADHMKICAFKNLELTNGALAYIGWQGAMMV